jgi:hypothetical protein
MNQITLSVPFSFSFHVPEEAPVEIAVTAHTHRLDREIRQNFDNATVDPTRNVVHTTLGMAGVVHSHLSDKSYRPEPPVLVDEPTTSTAAHTALLQAAEIDANKAAPEGFTTEAIRLHQRPTSSSDLTSTTPVVTVTWDGTMEVTWGIAAAN